MVLCVLNRQRCHWIRVHGGSLELLVKWATEHVPRKDFISKILTGTPGGRNLLLRNGFKFLEILQSWISLVCNLTCNVGRVSCVSLVHKGPSVTTEVSAESEKSTPIWTVFPDKTLSRIFTYCLLHLTPDLLPPLTFPLTSFFSNANFCCHKL